MALDSTDISPFQSATFYYIYLYTFLVIFSKKESEAVILKIIRYRHLSVYGLHRVLGFSNVRVQVQGLGMQVQVKVRVRQNWT